MKEAVSVGYRGDEGDTELVELPLTTQHWRQHRQQHHLHGVSRLQHANTPHGGRYSSCIRIELLQSSTNNFFYPLL